MGKLVQLQPGLGGAWGHPAPNTPQGGSGTNHTPQQEACQEGLGWGPVPLASQFRQTVPPASKAHICQCGFLCHRKTAGMWGLEWCPCSPRASGMRFVGSQILTVGAGQIGGFPKKLLCHTSREAGSYYWLLCKPANHSPHISYCPASAQL